MFFSPVGEGRVLGEEENQVGELTGRSVQWRRYNGDGLLVVQNIPD